jgi:hypothetical protein
MVTILFAVVSILVVFRFRSRAALDWPFCADSAPVDLSFHP